MKIYLFLDSELSSFSLPSVIIGSYTFDYNDEEESKLINIEARDGKWVIYSTNDVTLISNGNLVDSIILKSGEFYTLRRKDKDYLISFVDLSLDFIQCFSYDNDVNMIIGNNVDCNIVYSCELLNDFVAKIYCNNGVIGFENNKLQGIYVNNSAVKTTNYSVNIGDCINILGLKIMFFKGIILINNISGKLFINEESSKLKKYVLPSLELAKDIEIKDINLYNKDDYFSKAPRIRRIIETKDIKLSPPPRDGTNGDLPIILTVGPMLTMGISSGVTLLNTIINITSGKYTIGEQWPGLVTSGVMLLSMLGWPIIIQIYNRKMKKKKREEIILKYSKYLEQKRKELELERNTQKEILIENLIPVDKCVDIILNRSVNFWDKRIDQSDFLVVRIGKGNELLDAKIEYPEDGFTIEEDELKKQADNLVDEFKYINDVPVSYSFYDNKVTAVMGNINKGLFFINNVILQLITFYSYEDLKLVVFTQDKYKENWNYVRYLNHNFNNEKNFRFFASDSDSYKNVSEYLNIEVNNRIPNASNSKIGSFKPHYIIVIDDYDRVKRFDFIKSLTELDENIGFSIIILEERLSKLPSKCNNFITLGLSSSGVLKNSYEKQEQIIFNDEINYNINMLAIAKILANIPIEFEDDVKSLPNSISFLEMEKVGKVEQLNILNRWNSNDSTVSLKTEIGVDEQGDLMYLDLHEKYHGPHGLIAGTTGSGKSEFIITYILSMAVNYSPDDVAFILIDYKGGGLALAFENKATGVSLPHLAGTITNLDKAEMDRTLVSIDSEVKRRQHIFNLVRDKLGESTIDIYKYQSFFKEGRVNEPLPHLFIICDEFAELKSQQPDFMDNLISVARIGRSLGIHLILATQKPSGVVNDQIWSNTRFRVCLKVQDEADSKEMLKRPEAASIKQVGRYYLQVGYDEYFSLGQSAWCGAKYYPSDSIVKQVDKSINFINDCGLFIKSIQGASKLKIEAKGEQLPAILKNIIEASKAVNKKAKKLWLDNISSVISIDYLENKYNFSASSYDVKAVLGEYDAPEKQEQGLVLYDYLKDGNTIIYGIDGLEREKLLDTMICSTVKNHSVDEVNYYIIDYGSESFVKYDKLAHVGGIVVASEEEEYNNLLKFLKAELKRRKKLFLDYGGEYSNYIKNSNNKLPLYVVIINNYDSIYESNYNIYDTLPELVRDSARYGIVYVITANAVNSIQNKISTNFSNIYTFRLKDSSDYATLFGLRTKLELRDVIGRGLLKDDLVHEFQTANVVTSCEDVNAYLIEFIKRINQNNVHNADKIPVLPDMVRFNDVNKKQITMNSIPVGIYKEDLEVAYIDYLANVGNIITSNKIENTDIVVNSLIKIFASISNNMLMVIDPLGSLKLDVNECPNYYIDNIELVIDKINDYVKKLIEDKTSISGTIIIYGLNKFVNKIDDKTKLTNFVKNIKEYEKVSLIIVDDYSKIKSFAFETWFTGIFNLSEGLWVGKGISEQNLFRISSINKEMTKDINNNMGYLISENASSLIKLINFVSNDEEVDKDE